MNAWEQQFCQKLESIRDASRSEFEELADECIEPAFGRFRDFMTQQGFLASAPLNNAGVRTFKFALGENSYALLRFRLAGLKQVEVSAEYCVPGQSGTDPWSESTDLAELSEKWVRFAFEHGLDDFITALGESMVPEQEPELVGSKS